MHQFSIIAYQANDKPNVFLNNMPLPPLFFFLPSLTTPYYNNQKQGLPGS